MLFRSALKPAMIPARAFGGSVPGERQLALNDDKAWLLARGAITIWPNLSGSLPDIPWKSLAQVDHMNSLSGGWLAPRLVLQAQTAAGLETMPLAGSLTSPWAYADADVLVLVMPIYRHKGLPADLRAAVAKFLLPDGVTP